MTACVRDGECIVDHRHNKQRLERQTMTFKDTFSLFLMIFKLNIIKISVYLGYYGLRSSPENNFGNLHL